MKNSLPTHLSVPDRHRPSAARQNQWVVTCVDDAAYEELLVPFLGSLISLAKWDGSIAVFDYGLSRGRIERLQACGLLVEKVERRHNVVTLDRFLHLAGFAERHEGFIGHWDCDIWFLGSISDLFDHHSARHAGKLVCNLDHSFQESSFRVAKDPSSLQQVKRVLEHICQKHGQILQCGFMMGDGRAVAGYGRHLETFLEREGMRACWNTDTVGLNDYCFHYPDRIDVIDNRYNFLPDCLPYPLPADFSIGQLEIRGLHVTSPWRESPDGHAFLFRNSHPQLHQLWKEKLN